MQRICPSRPKAANAKRVLAASNFEGRPLPIGSPSSRWNQMADSGTEWSSVSFFASESWRVQDEEFIFFALNPLQDFVHHSHGFRFGNQWLQGRVQFKFFGHLRDKNCLVLD